MGTQLLDLIVLVPSILIELDQQLDNALTARSAEQCLDTTEDREPHPVVVAKVDGRSLRQLVNWSSTES